MLSKFHTECGFSWDDRDIVRFLQKCSWEGEERIHEKALEGGGTLTRVVRRQCLIYHGATSSGGASVDKNGKKRGKGRKQYGTFSTKGKSVRAHKFSAVAILGLRPGPGDEIDHNCYNTRCVSCLECVPRAVNQARIRRGLSNVVASNKRSELSTTGPLPYTKYDPLLNCRCTTILDPDDD